MHSLGARRPLTDRPTSVPSSVRLAGLGTAVPPHLLLQDDVVDRLKRLLDGRVPKGWLERIARNSGIAVRHAVRPAAWYDVPRTWPERSAAYVEGAGALFVAAAERALATAGVAAAAIDTVVTVSTTGVATPTLEARAFSRLGFRSNVRRVPLFGLGCAGGVTGLAIAHRLAAATPESRVLLVCVETCTLNLQLVEPTQADLVATLLFGDGAAAACLVHSDEPSKGPLLGDGVEHLWADTLDVMGWDVRDTGLGVVFDRSIPAFVDDRFDEAVNAAFAGLGAAAGAVERWVCHPGGPKVLEALERTLHLPSGTLDHERDVLRAFGNMSAPTALFVLERVLREGPRGCLVLTALGPGFTASLLPIHCGEG